MKKITGLSLFAGADVARMAMGELGLDVDWYSSEVDKYAIQAAKSLYSGTTYLGDITKWDTWEDDKSFDFSIVDIILAGFPCQSWSLAGKQKGDSDPRGALVHDLLDIWSHIKILNPGVKFMFENVAMKKEFMTFINNIFGCEPTMINSALLTAQNRKRNYWSNWDISQPDDKGILLRDIIESGVAGHGLSDKCATRLSKYNNADKMLNVGEKSLCLVASYAKLGRDNTYIPTELRPCEMREGKQPLNFMEWLEKYHPAEVCMTIDTNDYSELEDRYICGGGRGLYKKVEGHEFEYDIYLSNFLYSDKSPLCHHVATATDINANESNKRVYADTGKSPTVTTMGGGHREPKILVGRVVGRKINSETGKHDDYNPDLKTVQKDNVLILDLPVMMKQTPRGYNKGFEKEVDKTGTLTKNSWEQNNKVSTDGGAKYRKLTPRECMRLQGFTGEIINKLLESGISNSQLYKITGNAFTLPVIIHNIQCLLDTGWMQD